MDTEENMIEVFTTGDRMTAQAAIDEILTPAGIDAVIHDRVSTMLPAPASMPGAYFVAVPETQIHAAAEALREAMDGGIVEGELIEAVA
jgi:hypothetical protein